MLLDVLILVLALIVLVYASKVFVDATSSIAKNFKVPKTLIALTIASFGTCMPELAISFNSFSTGNGDLALANVLGSCIVNILLIIGLGASINSIKINKETNRKQLPILVTITSVFALSIIVNLLLKKEHIISWFDGVVLFLLFVVFMVYIIKYAKKNRGIEFRTKPKYSLFLSIVYTIICIIVIIISSDMVVDVAIKIANNLMISQKAITMTVIVIGTSLPELTTTIMASKKREYELALGNIIGTNIFNLGIVLGLPSFIYGGVISQSYSILDAIVVEISVILLYLFCKSDKKLTKIEGLLMLLVFIIYYTFMMLF